MFNTTDLARTVHADRTVAHRRAAEHRALRMLLRSRRRQPPPLPVPTGAHPVAGLVARLPGYDAVAA